MLVLGIESAADQCGCALADERGTIAEARLVLPRRHAEALAPQMRFVCEQAGVALGDIEAVAVDCGPGLYTGLRAGLATAKAMAARPMSDVDIGSLGLAELAGVAADCTLCPLSEGRTNVVFGTGNPNADLMIVGEGPGAEDDKQGLPFVGRSGKLLDKLLVEEVGLERSAVYIANVVKCRPPDNRDPLPEEIAACRPYLERQVELVGAPSADDPRQLRHQGAAGHHGRHHPGAGAPLRVGRRRGAGAHLPPGRPPARRR